MLKKAAAGLVLACLVTSAWAANDVRTIQYRSQKNSSYKGEKVITETAVYLDGKNVKIQYLSPEKRTLMLKGDTVYVVSETAGKPEVQSVPVSEVPDMTMQMLVPTIFGASSFLGSISKGFTVTKQKDLGGGAGLYVAVPLKPKNISRIEYVHNTKKDQVQYYKIFNREGGLLSEVRFEGYQTFEGRFVLPTKIKTLVSGREGLIEETETFKRIKVDQPVDKAVFEL